MISPTPIENVAESSRSLAEAELWSSFDGTFELEPSFKELHKVAGEDFYREIATCGQWEGQENLPDGNIENLYEWLDECEEDRLIDELLEHTSRQSRLGSASKH